MTFQGMKYPQATTKLAATVLFGGIGFLARSCMADNTVAPAQPGFNSGFFALSSPATGSNRCDPVLDVDANPTGWPYDNADIPNSDEHGANSNGKKCPDKLQSYEPFRSSPVAPDCFTTCPTGVAPDSPGNENVCGKAVWKQADEYLVAQFGLFSDAYQRYTAAHAASAAANNTFQNKVTDKNTKAATLTTKLVDLLDQSLLDNQFYDDDATNGLNESNEKVKAVLDAEDALTGALEDLQASKDQKIAKNKAFRERIFELDMQLLKTRDALYREVWSRDHACSIKTNNNKWLEMYRTAAATYENKAKSWQSQQDSQASNAAQAISEQQIAHDNAMERTEQAQQQKRNEFYQELIENLNAEDTNRENDLEDRRTENARMLIMARLLVYFRDLFANHTEALHANQDSAHHRRRQLAGSSLEERAIEAEVKERVRVSLIKTLKIDENAVRVTGISAVPGQASTYEVAYEVSCASDGEVQRLIPAIGGSGKALFHKAMQGQMQVEIASTKRTAMGAGTSVSGISSTSAQVRQRSSASSSGSMTISAAAGKFGEHAGSFLLSMVAPIVVSLALMALRR